MVPGLETAARRAAVHGGARARRVAAVRRLRGAERDRGDRLKTRKLAGYIPAGWFAALVTLSRDGRHSDRQQRERLRVGPNGGTGFVAPDRGLHPGDIMQGTLQIIPVPDDAALVAMTQQVVRNTYVTREVTTEAARHLPFANSRGRGPIKHIVFVVKENRTYDQVFGQRRGARGDAANTTLGLGMRVASKDGTRVLERVDVTPNHHALADAYAISDNFYCDADQSNTGHRWVVGVYPNEWVEVNARSRIEEKLFSPAPGRRYVAGRGRVGAIPRTTTKRARSGSTWRGIASRSSTSGSARRCRQRSKSRCTRRPASA